MDAVALEERRIGRQREVRTELDDAIGLLGGDAAQDLLVERSGIVSARRARSSGENGGINTSERAPASRVFASIARRCVSNSAGATRTVASGSRDRRRAQRASLSKTSSPAASVWIRCHAAWRRAMRCGISASA